MAGTTVSVVCTDVRPQNVDAPADGLVLGYVIENADGTFQHTIYLRNRICKDLEQMDTPKNPNMQLNSWDGTAFSPKADFEDGMAVSVLNHEAHHIKDQNGDEAVVECDAYMSRRAAVQGWGMAEWKQNRLYWGIKHFHSLEPANYRLEC